MSAETPAETPRLRVGDEIEFDFAHNNGTVTRTGTVVIAYTSGPETGIYVHGPEPEECRYILDRSTDYVRDTTEDVTVPTRLEDVRITERGPEPEERRGDDENAPSLAEVKAQQDADE